MERLRVSLQAIETQLSDEPLPPKEPGPRWPQLRAAYLDLVTLAGQLQGAVGSCRRERGDTQQVRAAEAALERLKSSLRQVGMDIRLASESALLIGLQTAVQNGFETLDWLDRVSM